MLKSIKYSSKKWGKPPFLVISILAFLLLSCHDGKELKPSNMPKDSCDLEVIVYIAAENSLGEKRQAFNNQSFADLDINEMLAAAPNIPLSNRLIIYYDSPLQPQMLEINRQEGKVILENRIEEDSADPLTFEKVLKHITTQYPSRRQALVMWSHASGWIPGPRRSFGIDNLTNSSIDVGSEMEIADMRRVFERMNLHFEYIMFDACFMQCIETAYELRNHTDYIIASPAEIPGNGAPYSLIMPMLMNPSESMCKSIVDTYFNSYVSSEGCIFSVIKTSELNSLLNLTRQLCPDYYTIAYNLDTYGIQQYCGYMSYSGWKPEFYDMGSVMNRVLSQSDYLLWTEQMERTVINKHFTHRWLSLYDSWDFSPTVIDPEHLGVASIFVPNAKYDSNTVLNTSIKETLWYKDFNLKE